MNDTLRLGRIAFAAGVTLTAIGIGVYQAWWTIVFAIGGTVIALAVAQSRSATRSIGIGSAVIGGAIAAGTGLFLLYGSTFTGRRPCDDCADVAPLWVASGVGSILLALVLVAVAWRLSRRSRERW